MNLVILMGRLGKDPEVRYTPTGTAVANFNIATSEYYKDSNGEKKEKTEWHRIVGFGRVAEIAGEYLTKGSQVLINGRLQTRSWEDRDGVKRYTTEVVMQNLEMLGSTQHKRPEDDVPPVTPEDDDIPF